MPPVYKKLVKLTGKSPICFSGTQIPESIADIITSDGEKSLKARFSKGQKVRTVSDDKLLLIQGAPLESGKNKPEQLRQLGASVWEELSRQRLKEVELTGEGAVFIAMGMALKDYRFEIYKKAANPYSLDKVSILSSSNEEIKELTGLTEAIFFARDLVNEPANILTAKELAQRIVNAGQKGNYSVEVLGKSRIKSLKMGGLLSVNQGSTKEPTFSIIEYKPKNAVNDKPIVLVGKGIVYDTGGLSLKPTANSMDIMKCDMGGAAAVAGGIHASALNNLPLHIIGLIPATDNQPGPDAYGPGDVITMYDGTQVEVMNTDAEGRLVMADALAYAKQYHPSLVMDLATLTGSSMRAIGNYAGATMGTADEKTKKTLINAGFDSHERLVEFPLWDDYDTDLHSDIADTRNLGPTPMADVIIAGKFLQKFTDYPWMHIDIAGPAYLPSSRGYLPKGATGFGVHLLYEFFKKLSA
ncbi:MAG TPA: leucyl aminopeptidase [Cryomorphaceae bacterium]|nr:leucyl aminopeptidase [Cryomorphaceae bacterium]